MIDARTPRLDPRSPLTIPLWPRGSMAGFMLQALLNLTDKKGDLVVERLVWVEAMAKAEAWATHSFMGAKTLQRATRLQRIEDPVSGHILLWWGDHTVLLCAREPHRTCTDGLDRIRVLPIVFTWTDKALAHTDQWTTYTWDALPDRDILGDIIAQTPAHHRLTPEGEGTLAAWADLHWVDAQRRQEVQDALLQCACWIGTRSGVWPKAWMGIVLGRAIATDGTLSEPSLQWGSTTDPTNPPTAHSYRVQQAGMDALRRWLSSDASPLAGPSGVLHGTPMGPNDCSGDTVASLHQAPNHWSAHARIALAEHFEARFHPLNPSSHLSHPT